MSNAVTDLVTTIIGDLHRNDVSISDIILIDVKSAIREYASQRFYFNEKTISLTFSATNTYALSLFASAASAADIVEVDDLTIQVNSTRTYSLEEMSAKEIFRRQGNSITGLPYFYCIYGQSVLLDTTPNIVLTANMAAHVKFTEVSAFSDSNVWTNDGFELIRNAALKRLWGRRFKDFESAQAAAEAERLELVSLRRRTSALGGATIAPYL